MGKKWSFRRITAIEEPVFNNTLERFYDLGIDGLVRENIQNSLDGKLPESKLPVQVTIKTGFMHASCIPGLEEVHAHIQNLKGENEYTKETISHMQSSMKKKLVPYISFEDCNTTGLSGAEHGEEIQTGDTWGVYAYKKGVHHTETDSERERSRGGSHGVGKIACNAASDLHLMFFANCDAEGKQHIGGTVQLIEHTMDGKDYRSTGYFTKVIGDKYYPFENRFDPIFKKDTRGLKIVIPFLRQQFQGQQAIIRAVCDNFFVAILENKLLVKVDDMEINNRKIKEIVSNPDIYEEQDYGDIKNNFTPLYIKSYMNQKPSQIQISDKKKAYHFSLYLLYDERIKKARVAIVRGIGMKIEDKRITSYVNAPFNAVLIPQSSEEDTYLKTLENESHTKLSFEHIKNPEVQANAKRFINNITREMQKIVSELLRQANPSDGRIDTADIIYSIETNFRKELLKEVSTVQLTKGRKDGTKTVVKVNAKSREREKRKKKRKSKNEIDKIVRRALKGDGKDTKKYRIRYPMYPESVKRIVLKDKERLVFDFTKVEQYSGENVCDISLFVIDGTGKLYDSEFDVQTSYSEIMDKNNGKRCPVVRNIIKDVTIVEGKVDIEMKITNRFNRSLKFMYYVEV